MSSGKWWLLCLSQAQCFNDEVWAVNTLRPRQNGRHLPDDIFKYIFLNEIVWISIKNFI